MDKERNKAEEVLGRLAERLKDRPPTQDLKVMKSRLPKEIRDYVYEGDLFGACFKHPLAQSIIFTGSGVEVDNIVSMIQKKEERIAELEEEGNLSSIVWLYERPWRKTGFLKHRYECKKRHHIDSWDKHEAKTVAAIWIDSENTWQSLNQWSSLFDQFSMKGTTHLLMDDDDIAFYNKTFPDHEAKVRIYRGANRSNGLGLSWTTDKEKARWFAKRFYTKGNTILTPRVYSTEVTMDEVVATFVVRGEKEVVLHHRRLPHLTITNEIA